MLEKEPVILSDTVTKINGLIKHERYLQGWYPNRGILTCGLSGQETIEHIEGVKAVASVTVYENRDHLLRDIVEELWGETWDYPIQWSIELSHTTLNHSEEHRRRLNEFQGTLLQKMKR